jgi:hypothetical protein
MNNDCQILGADQSTKYSWPYLKYYDTHEPCSGTPFNQLDLPAHVTCMPIGSNGDSVQPSLTANSHLKYNLFSVPTALPTASPTAAPSAAPTKAPTAAPTVSPTFHPTTIPTKVPTVNPTNPVPSQSPTLAPTAGHLLTLTGDVSLNNIDYSAFSASEKNDFLEGAENALESLWHLNDGSVVVTADATTTRRRLTTNSGVVLHFTIVATDLSITGSSSSSGSAVTQSMKEEINTHFFAALQTSVAANPALQAAVGAAQVQEVTVTDTNSSSEDDKESSGPNLLVIILPVVLGFVFIIVAVVVALVYFFQSSATPCSGASHVEVMEKKPVEGTVGYAPVVAQEQNETAVVTNKNGVLAI